MINIHITQENECPNRTGNLRYVEAVPELDDEECAKSRIIFDKFQFMRHLSKTLKAPAARTEITSRASVIHCSRNAIT